MSQDGRPIISQGDKRRGSNGPMKSSHNDVYSSVNTNELKRSGRGASGVGMGPGKLQGVNKPTGEQYMNQYFK